MTLQVEVVSPERILYSGEAEWVKCRTVGGGDIVFLTGHAPLIGALEIFEVQVHLTDGRDQLVAVHGGFVEVSNNRVTVLSDVAELPDQIDVARARAARDRAATEAQAAEQGTPEHADAASAKARAETRLRVTGTTPDP